MRWQPAKKSQRRVSREGEEEKRRTKKNKRDLEAADDVKSIPLSKKSCILVCFLLILAGGTAWRVNVARMGGGEKRSVDTRMVCTFSDPAAVTPGSTEGITCDPTGLFDSCFFRDLAGGWGSFSFSFGFGFAFELSEVVALSISFGLAGEKSDEKTWS